MSKIGKDSRFLKLEQGQETGIGLHLEAKRTSPRSHAMSTSGRKADIPS